MNLFVLSPDAGSAAALHCDKHVVKMILETCQLLYTAWAVVGTARFAPSLERGQELDVSEDAVCLDRNALRVSWRCRSKPGRVTVAAVKRDAEGQRLYVLSDGGCFEDPTLEAYKATHKSHPCARWVRAHPANYRWAAQLGLALCAVYTKVFKKTHKCEPHLRCLSAMEFPGDARAAIERKVATADLPHGCADFYVAIGDDVFDSVARYTEDGRLKAVETYREYYKVKPFAMTWRDREAPGWM